MPDELNVFVLTLQFAKGKSTLSQLVCALHPNDKNPIASVAF